MVIPFVIAGWGWGVLYFFSGLFIPGWIPFSYGFLSIANVLVFHFSKNYKAFRNIQLFLILILPFALQVSLGGFVPSSAVLYWAIIAPAGAMFFSGVKKSLYWFAAYLMLALVAFLINSLLPEYVNYNISDRYIDALFLMNIIGVSSTVFAILYYFVSKITRLNQDIAHKNRLLSEQSDKLKKLDELKTRFFTNISHEFRTPLTLILGLLDKQQNNPNVSPDPADTEVMQRNADRLLQLINHLLSLSKLEAGELRLQLRDGDIVTFTKQIAAQFESLADSKNIQLLFNCYPLKNKSHFAPHVFMFDPEQLYTVINNLLSNAFKFTPKGGRVEINITCDGDLAVIEVINTGKPIPADQLSEIFNRFYQADNDDSRQFEGTGIGLALVKELVELHSGSVSVSSDEQLTSFKINLPTNLQSQVDQEIEIREFPMQHKSPDHKSKTTLKPAPDFSVSPALTGENVDRDVILVVEDNADLRKYISSLLEGYNVELASDGLEGYTKAIELIPDLVITDIMMPGIDGVELCNRLKADRASNHIPVIMLTAKGSKEDKLEGLLVGADDYLVKPFDQDELKVRINNLLSTRKLLQKKYRQYLVLEPGEVEVTSAQQQFIEDIKKNIENNLDDEHFGVEELCRNIGLSRSQMHRKLKALTDTSISSFIRHYRLHRAADLLKQQAGTISEIAYRVGFSSPTYFSSSFTELFGSSPTAYRENALKGDEST